MLQRIIGGLLLMFIGGVLTVNPHGVWDLAEKWKLLGNADASPQYLKIIRMVGTAFAVIGFLVLLGIMR